MDWPDLMRFLWTFTEPVPEREELPRRIVFAGGGCISGLALLVSA